MSPMSALLQRDEVAREAALHVGHSILLQAPAGSGKTTVLVCRVLALLVAGEEPESILAITFSRKAAAEMRQRVMHALQVPDDPRHPAALRQLAQAALARDRERRWELLRNPARLRVQTFDALNQRLAAQAPVQSGGGAGLSVTENTGALYARAARRLLERAWQGELAGAARILLEHLDNSWEQFETLLAKLLAERLQWLPQMLTHGAAELADQVEQTLATLVQTALQDCLQQWPALGDARTAVVLGTTADNLYAAGNDQDEMALAWRTQSGPLRTEPGDLLRWRQACRLLLTAKGEWRRSLTKKDGVPTEDPAFKQRALAWLNDMQAHAGLHAALIALDSLPDLPVPLATREALRRCRAARRVRHERQCGFQLCRRRGASVADSGWRTHRPGATLRRSASPCTGR
jgi:ATP-dependent exoDNAse (exonuclease V) beta subunit